MAFSSCPFCDTSIPSLEIERHVNNHLMEDELEKDMELAHQVALAPPSPGPLDVTMNYRETYEKSSARNSEPSISGSNSTRDDQSNILVQEKISCLTGLQIESSFDKIEGGLMTLLKRCLELEKGNSRSFISGHVDHYQSIKSEDSGWGCGWRNIQMLSSHILLERQEARDTLFGGVGFVPDIPSLQRWVEIAWERGFDNLGSESFNHRIYGSVKWIGTTECATLFRSFGIRARIVDFDLISCESNGKYKGKRKVKQVSGPMDKFCHRERFDGSQMVSCQNSQPEHITSLHKNSTDHNSSSKCQGGINGHQVLVDWVWDYFTGDGCGRLDDSQRVIISKKSPLYFQHHGHSRTIVGIQMQKGLRNSQDRYSLLILDPGHRTADLEKSLRDNDGWQKLIKRGVHTLRKPQYQLCYVDRGIARGEEMEQLKTIDSILIKL